MKNYFFTAVLLFLKLQTHSQALSPSTVSAGGLFSSSGGISLSSTIGQSSLIETFSISSIMLTQGFQQPEDNSTVGIQVMEDESLQVMVFPNPTMDRLQIEYYDPKNQASTVRLVNILGSTEVLPFQLQSGHQKTLDLKSLAAGIYFLEVKTGNHTSVIKITRAQ